MGFFEMRLAIESGNLSAVEAALSSMADINECEFYVEELDSNLSALHLSAYFGRESIVAALLRRGAFPDVITREREAFLEIVCSYITLGFWGRAGRYTALHLASIRENAGCIKLLLANGADYKIKDRKGNLALTPDKLCNNICISDRLICLDFSIYGLFKAEYIPLIATALSLGTIKVVNFEFPPIDFDKGFIIPGREGPNEELELLLRLLAVLKSSRNLCDVTLSVKYIFNTQHSIGSYLLPDQLIYMRKGLVKVLNALLGLTELNSLVKVSFGCIQHVHKKISQESYTETYSEREYPSGFYRNRTVTKTREKVEYETKDLLRIDNDTMRSIARDPAGSKQHLGELDNSIMWEGDSWARIFSSQEARMAKKILDAEVIVGFCSRFSSALRAEDEVRPAHISASVGRR